MAKIELMFDQTGELDQVAPMEKDSQLEILSLQFNQYLNMLALGDSDGFVGVGVSPSLNSSLGTGVILLTLDVLLDCQQPFRLTSGAVKREQL